MITNFFLYNIVPYSFFNDLIAKIDINFKIKRKIDLKTIFAITVANFGDEFVLHVPDEYDYRFSSDKFFFFN